MHRPALRIAFVGAVVAGIVGGFVSVAGASASSRIRPDQFFIGTVNGRSSGAVINVVCPGPVGTLGHPVAGQPLEVQLSPAAGSTIGFTGSKGRAIVVELAVAKSTSPSGIVRFTHYGVPRSFPTSLLVPCSGEGVVIFDPVPGSPTARAYTVGVTFTNIATS